MKYLSDNKQESYEELIRVGFIDAQAVAIIELSHENLPIDMRAMVEKLIGVGFTDKQADVIVLVKLAGTITFGSQYAGYLTNGEYKAGINYDNRDHILVGRLLDTNDVIGFHADNIAELSAAFEEAVEDYQQAAA